MEDAFFYICINRSFCSEQEQKDDTISCQLAVRLCVCECVFECVCVCCGLSFESFLMTNRVVCICANGNESTEDAEDGRWKR